MGVAIVLEINLLRFKRRKWHNGSETDKNILSQSLKGSTQKRKGKVTMKRENLSL